MERRGENEETPANFRKAKEKKEGMVMLVGGSSDQKGGVNARESCSDHRELRNRGSTAWGLGRPGREQCLKQRTAA